MHLSATDQEKLGQATISVYMTSTVEVLDVLLFMYILFLDSSCFVSVFSSFTFIWKSFGILKNG